ncbi:unnamed protein product, partial [Didymodactylos carnosus]
KEQSIIQTHSASNSNRKLKYDDDDLQDFLYCSTDKKSDNEDRLLENRYYRSFLSWKIQNYISDTGYQQLNRLEEKYRVKCPPFSTINKLKKIYSSWIPLKTLEYGCYMDVRHAILILASLNPHILNNLKDKNTLHFRLCQDGTWL